MYHRPTFTCIYCFTSNLPLWSIWTLDFSIFYFLALFSSCLLLERYSSTWKSPIVYLFGVWVFHFIKLFIVCSHLRVFILFFAELAYSAYFGASMKSLKSRHHAYADKCNMRYIYKQYKLDQLVDRIKYSQFQTIAFMKFIDFSHKRIVVKNNIIILQYNKNFV